MDRTRLDKWAELLLDLGKRNNFINFRTTKKATAEVICPDIETIFEKICGGDTLEIYNSGYADEDVGFTFSDEAELEAKKEIYRAYVQTRLNKKQIALFSEYPIGTVFKTINDKANEIIDETGINVLYLAFGAINWKEKDDSSIIYKAPVLLIPVKLICESITEPYRISMADDVIPNESFAFKLNEEYGMTLPAYNEGSIRDYLNEVRDSVSVLDWTVSDDCKIGIFSYQKLNMYRDLTDNAERVLANPNVRQILGEQMEAPDLSFADNNASRVRDPLSDLCCIVDADSSQLEAIEMARSGKSFVLQGPPGTGKSQTITNIIADSLSEGKKVLFVSEKLAALNVVYNKLKQEGLSEFCLELHSHKANKKGVIDEICHTLRLPKTGVNGKAEDEIRYREKARTTIDEYASDLHTKRKIIKKSLYELFEEHSALRDYPDVDWRLPDLKGKGEEYLNDTYSLISNYADYTDSIGYDYRKNPWYGYIEIDNSYATRRELEEDLSSFSDVLRALIEARSDIINETGVSFGSIRDAAVVCDVFRGIASSDIAAPKMLDRNSSDTILSAMYSLKGIGDDIISYEKYINKNYTEDVYRSFGDISVEDFKEDYRSPIKRAFSKEYRNTVSALRKYGKRRNKPSFKEVVEVLEKLEKRRDAYNNFIFKENEITGSVGKDYNGVYSDWDSIISDAERICTASKKTVDFDAIAKMSEEEFASEKSYFGKTAETLAACLTKGALPAERFDRKFDQSILNVYEAELTKLLEKIDACIDGFGSLDNYCHFRELLKDLSAAKVLTYIDCAVDSGIWKQEMAPCFKKAFISQWIDKIVAESPALSRTSRIPHDSAVKTFAEKDLTLFEINKAKIRAVLSQNRPSIDLITPGSELAKLLREGEKKRKLKSVRTLLEEAHETIQKVKPCFLMSPLSVSTYLPSGAVKFDIVIFDEASQVFPQDAVGAIYRADQLIVVGDSKQMPPTNFFNIVPETDEEEEEDITDFESILDICSATMRQLRLKWHYRSKYEQLITFSNKGFYDSELITFPAPDSDKPDTGVDYCYTDGQYDRKSHTNIKEAERVADLVFEHIRKHPERSLGVVAFSVAQQERIDMILSKRRLESPEFEDFFKEDKNEPFFIKNLETVQGDERDTIIFSVAYGPDAVGKFYHNFGPINRAGGERRLNVAVTRAKYNVKLVTSIHYSDIDLKKTGAIGSRMLRDYLNYAECGEVALEKSVNVDSFDSYDSDFEEEVHEFLLSRGFSADTQVGCSGFRIDIGVKLPDSSDYVLAVECDGATYHSSKNARDRDRLRQQILEKMGWKFYRIWSTDWYKNKQDEKLALLNAATAAVLSKNRNDPEVSEKKIESEEFVINTDDNIDFPKYNAANIPSNIRKYEGANYLKIVCEILKDEAPLSEEFLLKRTVSFFGREKVTSFVLDEYKKCMKTAARFGIIRKNGFLYLADTKIESLRVPGDITREIKYICPEELAAGMLEIIRQNGSVEKNGLYRVLAAKCGFHRLGAQIEAQFDEALFTIKGKLSFDGEIISLKEKS